MWGESREKYSSTRVSRAESLAACKSRPSLVTDKKCCCAILSGTAAAAAAAAAATNQSTHLIHLTSTTHMKNKILMFIGGARSCC
jgi:histidine ammonia-lyase